MKHHHPLPFGAELVDGGVRFRLWAPKAQTVSLCIEGQSKELEMRPESGGWFQLTTAAARPGVQYRYRIDRSEVRVADPASRHQPADVHGPSEVIDPTAYDWKETGWRGRPWEEIIIYELHVGTFSRDGDFAGVHRHLDHLVKLGVTAIELLPVADFPGERNWGYDGVLLFAPDARYGRPDDLKRLIEACHERGLSAILDVVYNHFGPDGNYLPTYAPAFFTEKHKTPWGAAINFDTAGREAVRQFYVENALYWLEEYRFDGLRFDAVHAILDDSRPDIVTEIAETIRKRIADRPIHLVLENDKNQARYLRRDAEGRPVLHTAQWNDDFHHALRVVTSGQTGGYYADYADDPVARLGRALAEGFVYQGDPSAYRDGEIRGEASAHLPPTAFVSFIQNHDQVGNDAFGARLPKLATPEALRAAAATYLLAPQIPMIFQGEEWGTEQPFAFFVDFADPDLAEAVRTGRREEFAKFPEFADPTARDRIPDPTSAETYRSSILDWSAPESSPHREWLAFYRDLIALRRREIVPRLGGMRGHAAERHVLGKNALRVEWRLGDGSFLTLLANYGHTPVEAPPIEPGSELLLATSQDDARSDRRQLPPRSVAFYLRKGRPE
jgi:maltooligosyltrehalose trehalohydrolase